MSELPHSGVRSHHSMAGCVICSESHMSELPHRGVRQNGKSNHINSFSAKGPESSHMPELSHPCAIKIKVRNHLKIDRTGVR